MDSVQGIILGVLQGLTEFLPVSSTAHLRLVPALLGWPDPGAAWSAVVQLGTLLAVLVYFFRDLWGLLVAFLRGLVQLRPFANQQSRLAWILILGTVPIAVAGLLFEDAIETRLRSLWVVATALIVLAALLGVAEMVGKRSRTLAEVGWIDGLAIGVAQALALVPGTSRSGITITAGLFAGLTRADAARFSFLLSVPAVAASGVYELLKIMKTGIGGSSWISLLLPCFAAAVSGYLAIAGLIRLLQTRSTLVFIVYRVLLGITLICLLFSGHLTT